MRPQYVQTSMCCIFFAWGKRLAFNAHQRGWQISKLGLTVTKVKGMNIWATSVSHDRPCTILKATLSPPHCPWTLFSSVTQLCPTLCNPMDCSTPSFPVLHQLLFELALTHVHWVGDAIQPSHPLSSPSPPALNLPSIRVFSNESALCIRWPKYWSFNISPSSEHSGLSPLGWTGRISLQSKGLSRVFTNTIVKTHQFFRAQLSLWSNSHIHTWLLEKS